MKRKIIVKTLAVKGMTCPNCEMRLENKLRKMPGIIKVKAKYADETIRLTFDSALIDLSKIIAAIESLHYTVETASVKKRSKDKNSSANQTGLTNIMGIGVIIFAIYFLIESIIGFNFIPEVSQNMGYGLLFTVGVLTSLHCVAMCGGINLSQCVLPKSNKDDNLSKLKPSILYNAGRVVSYTVIGGIVGALGSVISLSGIAKGFVAIIAGIFMIIMGLNMINVFPWLRKFTPGMPKIFGNKIYSNETPTGPFIVGLLNGLMPCGPLQTMQIYALGTGSITAGALSMFMFSIGTAPLMFGLGAVSSMLSNKFTQKMMKVSAVLVMVLGIGMLNNGLSLSGINIMSFNLPFANETTSKATVSSEAQYVTTKISSGRYSPITVQKGIPVKWTIQATEDTLNGCNNPIIIPKYNIKIKLKPGDNIIEFTPDETGTIPYSCWMGMIRSKITVVENIN